MSIPNMHDTLHHQQLLTREYRDPLSYVTFLVVYCQLRVNSGEINSFVQFSVLSVL